MACEALSWGRGWMELPAGGTGSKSRRAWGWEGQVVREWGFSSALCDDDQPCGWHCLGDMNGQS